MWGEWIVHCWFLSGLRIRNLSAYESGWSRTTPFINSWLPSAEAGCQKWLSHRCAATTFGCERAATWGLDQLGTSSITR